MPSPANGPTPAARIGPKSLRLVPAALRRGRGGLVVGEASPGGKLGISLADWLHHVHMLGPTGTGKSSLLLRMILDDIVHGRGVAVFDPKGDLIRDLLDRMPADCGQRLVIIDPDETGAPPALNLLDPANSGGSAHHTAAHVTAVMGKVWSRWWGHRTADIAHHALLTLAHTPGTTLAHLPKLLSDTDWRATTVAAVTGRLDRGQASTLGEFWAAYESVSVAARAAVTAPLLAKLRLVLAHPLAAGLFGVPATTFTLPDILAGAILLVRLPKGQVGEDGTRLIGSLLLAGLWQATTARARLPEHARPHAHIYVDECHNFLHLPIGIDDALAEARGLKVGFALAHQYLGQLGDDMAEAIDANARNKIYFALAPADAARLARHVQPWLHEGDLTRLDAFEAVLRPIADGRAIPPSTVDTLAPPSPIRGRAQALRAAARAHTGLSASTRAELLAAESTGTQSQASSAGQPHAGAKAPPGQPYPRPNGPGTRSQANAHANWLAQSTPTEQAPQPASPEPANRQVGPDEQEW